jgi:glycosyltransferase involved in cell wall biosynthesis
MRIAQVAPLDERVPPLLYGGTERIVSYLTEELVHRAHEVTLFASGDSVTRARLVPCSDRSLRLDKRVIDRLAYHVLMLEEVFARADDFDVIHFHIDYLHFPLSRRQQTAHLTTLHGRLDGIELIPLYKRFGDAPVVSISRAQREPLPWINWRGNVYHGLPVDLYRPGISPGDYLLFLGRISREKRLDLAVEIAKRAGMRLKVAAKIDAADRKYFKKIESVLDDARVEYVGEAGEAEKQELLANAYALLFPIDWPEPFGLVLIEAMACGTPVIAFHRGSVPEIIEHGVTGFIVDDLDGAARAVAEVARLDRKECRTHFEEHFSAARMAEDYLRIYERLLND